MKQERSGIDPAEYDLDVYGIENVAIQLYIQQRGCETYWLDVSTETRNTYRRDALRIIKDIAHELREGNC